MHSSEIIYCWFCFYWIKYFTGSAEACWGRYALSSDCLPAFSEIDMSEHWEISVSRYPTLKWVTKFASAMSHKCYRCCGLQGLFVEKTTSTKWKKNCRIEQLSNSR